MMRLFFLEDKIHRVPDTNITNLTDAEKTAIYENIEQIKSPDKIQYTDIDEEKKNEDKEYEEVRQK